MSGKTLIERNPYREKSALFKIFQALARSQKPLDAAEVAKRATVNSDTTQRMLNSMANFYHNAGMRRHGVTLLRKDRCLSLKATKPDSSARRPERSKPKSAGKKQVKNGKKSAKAKHRNEKDKSSVQATKRKAAAAPKVNNAKPAPAPNPGPEVGEVKIHSLNEREKLVLATLTETPKLVDQIIAESKLKPEEALATLLVLEVRRLATQHPGKQYSTTAAK